MMKKLSPLLILASTLLYGSCHTNEDNELGPAAKGDVSFVPTKDVRQAVSNETLAGAAWQQVVVKPDGANNIQVSTVTCEAGSRNNWHVHPRGQVIMVTDGEGYYQDKGGPKRLLRKGDIVNCMPGLIHWHGATPDSKFSYIAIKKQTHHGLVQWHEPVSNEE